MMQQMGLGGGAGGQMPDMNAMSEMMKSMGMGGAMPPQGAGRGKNRK